MVALTYGDTRVSGVETKTATKTTATTESAPRQTWFSRFLTAMMESRMRQAEREVRLYARLTPAAHDAQADLPFPSVSSDTPRGGW